MNPMATSRDQSQFSRRRSNTAQSTFRAMPSYPPLKVGESKVFHAWKHDPVKESPSVIFNQSLWQGVAEGDLLKLTNTNSTDDSESAFLFVVPKDEGNFKSQLQISLPAPIADAFGVRNYDDVLITKVDRSSLCADYVEFTFKDQYLGRNDMWRLAKHLSGQCVYTNQDVTFIGEKAATISEIYIGGKKVSSACMTSSTKTVYRSLSAKITIFIQVCRELWEFAGDGERYNEKIIHSFLPTLFEKWSEASTKHTVTIVLMSRVFYDDSEIGYAAGPLRRDERGEWYKDFYKVITDLEVIDDWKPTLVSLKDSFWDFQRDILLTHHYHRATLDSAVGAPTQVRLVGRLSYAQDGPILEALNLGLNPTENHYIDRSLNLTGSTTILISPGSGYFRVTKQLLRLTTTRLLDQGFVLNLVLLNKPPLYQSPVFSFQGLEPIVKPGSENKERKVDPLLLDPLWGGEDDSKADPKQMKTFWWEPFWISTNFWDRQKDLPFRQDRFVARAKMHEIEMLGLLDHDVLPSIEVPYIPERPDANVSPLDSVNGAGITKADADKFDLDIFALTTNYNNAILPSTPNGAIPSTRPNAEKRASHRHSTVARIDTIEESPKIPVHKELFPETPIKSAVKGRSSSPSQSSVRSARSARSTKSTSSTKTSSLVALSKSTLASKLAPSWLFNPFRSGPSEPQTTEVSASASPTSSEKKQGTDKPSVTVRPPSSPIRMPPPSKPTVAATSQQMQPVAIRKSANRASFSRTFEEETLAPHRASLIRRSPINTPPRDDILASKRRSGASTLSYSYNTSSSPSMRTNPTKPRVEMTYSQASLARRWQHIYPQPWYKHDFKWKTIVTPGCLPLTVEHFPSSIELESSYDVFSYEFVVDPSEMRSFLVKPPVVKGNAEDLRRAWALVVMRGMAAVRLAQGFQFILKPKQWQGEEEKPQFRRTKSFVGDDDLFSWPTGAAEVLSSTTDPVYLSMTNEIHRISYDGELIQVRRYVRRMSLTAPFHYKCLIWPKLGGGYTELPTEFKSHGLENYGWNRLDMLVAGYEHEFNESLKYWRTRFIVVPTLESPEREEANEEKLSDEELRILGIEKLAELFTKLRWQPPEEKIVHPPVRFLPTTLDPAMSVLDEALMDQLDQIHASGPLRKNMRSEREIADMSLSAIAKAMREEGAVPIKFYTWHSSQYPDSFIGYDFVSWLVREFRDVSSRVQGTEWGIRLQEQGLFEHCRGKHSFLDGHYYYRLTGEYSSHTTPKYWFRRQLDDGHTRPPHIHTPSSRSLPKTTIGRRPAKKRLILSQTMAINIDPLKKSDQAECVVLHHDIIHNPGTVFHFELQWIGTTARCIEEQLKHWNSRIEKYGLKLVEAYVTQISDIRETNGFQSCYPLRLCIPPPNIPDLELRIPESTHPSLYFEYALLNKFNFIVDVEAGELYPDTIDVVYSYRRLAFRYSQFVHRTGVAFIQVVGGTQGFFFLTNRLMAPGRVFRPATAAEVIRTEMAKFCMDKGRLQAFYDEVVAALPPSPPALDEPPSLNI